MYKMSNKLRLSAIIFMVVGVLGIAYGFWQAPSSKAEAKELLEHKAEHGDSHAETANTHQVEGQSSNRAEEAHSDEHLEHAYHQMQNRPWSAVFVPMLFFFLIAVGALVFYAIQNVSQAGWSPLLFRVMQGISNYMLPGGILIFLFLILSSLQLNHLYIWMDPETVAHDEVIQEKSAYLNIPFFFIRSAIILFTWSFFRHLLVKNSVKQDDELNLNLYKKNVKLSIAFLAIFIITEAIVSWDWIMSIDTHWFSTLFGWFVFASMFVSAITTIALVSIYLKSKGLLEQVNDSHIHDLAKFMFAFSIFWTYLWFSQFMLIWYANMPEEAVYFVSRIENYKLMFFGIVAINFVGPVLILMNSDFKRINWLVVLTGILILVGHYFNFFLLIMPGTVGDAWAIGIPEIGSLLFFLGLFIWFAFKGISKLPLVPKNSPFLKESQQYHY
ncbi:quinol:cytochrome C oxidoreductase [Flavobacterium sp. CS20]|uniref:quinol:cytochrome C oxidoreductase n=1 Tax=Flavobacterium sp. CS20 TaxID=2775246 RepID=UPI001B3A244C|nr:quinol:cytochrome C oxidoreductase [Flavobacterium sp. CS20]QTY25866.1 quinol:cytochrome C oxidoreductase [Flavobacterium sp. CS20]